MIHQLLHGHLQVVQQNAPRDAIHHGVMDHCQQPGRTASAAVEKYEACNRAIKEIQAALDEVSFPRDLTDQRLIIQVRQVDRFEAMETFDTEELLFHEASNLFESHSQGIMMQNDCIDRPDHRVRSHLGRSKLEHDALVPVGPVS